MLTSQQPIEKKRSGLPSGGGRLAARFRRMNVLLFAAAFFVIAVLMTVLFNRVIASVSSVYAEQYALSSAEALSAHITREIDLVSQIAHSEEVVAWMADENDLEKRAKAVRDVENKVSELYSYNLYVVLNRSLNQYRIGVDYVEENIVLMDVLNENTPKDDWFFSTMNSDGDYQIDIGIDLEMHRKRVWIDYKVILDDEVLGVISTGLEFSHVVGELFAHYDGSSMRGLIIDEFGIIHMDSDLLHDESFLYSEFQARIDEEFTNQEFLSIIEKHLSGFDDPTEEAGRCKVFGLSTGPYRNATISPIRSTNWSVVILSGSTSLFDMSYFVPILITVLVLLLAVALVTSAANYRLIFLPLGKLDQSLSTLRESIEGKIYGAERDDELGDLSKTIQDLFTKANIDALTGIYNRRFMENNLEQIMEMLSRGNGVLSVLMLDIDYFKRYNDEFGHDQGDKCLKAVARSLTGGIMRISDFAARYGGEEFVAVLPNTDEKGARVVAEKLLEKVHGLGIPHPKNTAAPCVTVSIGGTTGMAAYGQSWRDYIKRADEALYISKNDGRNRYTFLEMQ